MTEDEKTGEEIIKTIKFEHLPPAETRVLKIIRIEAGKDKTWFAGDLPYTRKFSETYTFQNHQDGDLLDKLILESIQADFPESKLKLSKPILLKGELEEQIGRLHRGSQMEVSITFQPEINEEEIAFQVGREFKYYNQEFRLRLLFSEKEKKHPIMPYFSCKVPRDLIDDLVKTISPV